MRIFVRLVVWTSVMLSMLVWRLRCGGIKVLQYRSSGEADGLGLGLRLVEM